MSSGAIPLADASAEGATRRRWLVMRAHEPLVDADRAKELSIEISRKLVELAADGVTDPAQLRRLTLESLPLSPAH